MPFKAFYTFINNKITFNQCLKYSNDNNSYYKDYITDFGPLYKNEHIIKY